MLQTATATVETKALPVEKASTSELKFLFVPLLLILAAGAVFLFMVVFNLVLSYSLHMGPSPNGAAMSFFVILAICCFWRTTLAKWLLYLGCALLVVGGVAVVGDSSSHADALDQVIVGGVIIGALVLAFMVACGAKLFGGNRLTGGSILSELKRRRAAEMAPTGLDGPSDN
jgi:hypothetical protein